MVWLVELADAAIGRGVAAGKHSTVTLLSDAVLASIRPQIAY